VILIVLIFVTSTFVFATRTLNSLFGNKKIRFRTKLICELTLFFSWLFYAVFFDVEFTSALILTLVWHAFFLIFEKYCAIQIVRVFREEIEAFLDRAILHMMSGNSFRVSCSEATKTGDAFSQQEIKKILSRVFFKQQTQLILESQLATLIEQELLLIDEHSHSALNRLKGLRRNLMLESEFRQKSEQIKGRVWVQTIFMLGLYIAVLIFLFRQQEELDLASVAFSVTFFVIGLVWTIIDGRKMKWKT